MGQGRGGGLLEGRGPWRMGSLRQGKEGYPVSGGQSRGQSRHFGCGGQQVERGRLEPHSDLSAGWGGEMCLVGAGEEELSGKKPEAGSVTVSAAGMSP